MDYNAEKTSVKDMYPEDRCRFIRKVFIMICIQVLITTMVTGFFVLHPKLVAQSLGMGTGQDERQGGTAGSGSNSFHDFMLLHLMAISGAVGAMIAMLPKWRNDIFRNAFTGYLLMLAFAVAEGVCFGSAALQFQAQSLLDICVGATAITIDLALIATVVDLDFTTCRSTLLDIISLLISGPPLLYFMGFLPPEIVGSRSERMQSGIVALLYGLLVIADLQGIATGSNTKRKEQFDEDDCVIAALNIYSHITHVFLFLIEAFGRRQ
mmetsp:Transcript_36963/g.84577  ORF Transcript_36963/g.84577 Transcript_36963/m.84577 type:complete len:266 (+) Transcript_36963:98-895(+)